MNLNNWSNWTCVIWTNNFLNICSFNYFEHVFFNLFFKNQLNKFEPLHFIKLNSTAKIQFGKNFKFNIHPTIHGDNECNIKYLYVSIFLKKHKFLKVTYTYETQRIGAWNKKKVKMSKSALHGKPTWKYRWDSLTVRPFPFFIVPMLIFSTHL